MVAVGNHSRLSIEDATHSHVASRTSADQDMSLNLHQIVRGSIQAVAADFQAVYLPSAGVYIAPDGTREPSYQPPRVVWIQAQPPTGRDLQHINMLNMQGIFRTIFMYSNPQAINRVNALGGDLFRFGQWQPREVFDSNGHPILDDNGNPVLARAPVDNWLTVQVAEWWDDGPYGWTKLYVALQTDGRQIVVDSNLMPVLDDHGCLVRSIP
jgi:hypothetical protein